jgi:hypothetical protein
MAPHRDLTCVRILVPTGVSNNTWSGVAGLLVSGRRYIYIYAGVVVVCSRASPQIRCRPHPTAVAVLLLGSAGVSIGITTGCGCWR